MMFDETIPWFITSRKHKKRSCTAIVTEIALSLDGMKCDAAVRGVVLAVLLIGHAAAGSREQVQSVRCDHDVLQCLSESDCRLRDDM